MLVTTHPVCLIISAHTQQMCFFSKEYLFVLCAFGPVCGLLSYFITLVSVVLERVTERCQLFVCHREIKSSCMM